MELKIGSIFFFDRDKKDWRWGGEGRVSNRFAVRRWAQRARVRVKEAGCFPGGSAGRACKQLEQKGSGTG